MHELRVLLIEDEAATARNLAYVLQSHVIRKIKVTNPVGGFSHAKHGD